MCNQHGREWRRINIRFRQFCRAVKACVMCSRHTKKNEIKQIVLLGCYPIWCKFTVFGRWKRYFRSNSWYRSPRLDTCTLHSQPNRNLKSNLLKFRISDYQSRNVVLQSCMLLCMGVEHGLSSCGRT